jgi:hypothetical protein
VSNAFGNSRGGKKSWKLELTERFIRANPEASIAEIVKACRTSLSTVSRARANLIDEGVIPQASTGRPHVSTNHGQPEKMDNEGPTVEAQIAADIDAFVTAGGKALSREERRLRLSAYADHPKVPHAQKIAALRELENTEATEESQVGPGPPQSREDAIQRARLILEAVEDIYGKDARAEAIA